MKEIVEKREVEELLGCEITDEQFEEALKYARHKQEYMSQPRHQIQHCLQRKKNQRSRKKQRRIPQSIL